MKKIYTPVNEVELAIVRSMLDSAGIPYRIVNQYFGSLYIGPAMGSLNSKPVMVPEEYFEEAREILSNFADLEEQIAEDESQSGRKENGIFDDLAELLELLYRKIFRNKK